MRRGNNNTFVWIAVVILGFALLSQNGFHLNPTVNGTPVGGNIPGVQLNDPSATPALTVTPGPGVDLLATANAIAAQTLMANGNITPTETLLPGITPTNGPTATPMPLILQMGDISETLSILQNIQIGYESSTIVAGSQVGCDAQQSDPKQVNVNFFKVPFIGYQFGIYPENSVQQSSLALCVTIKSGWQFSDLRLDLNKSVIHKDYQTVATAVNPANGQEIITQKPVADLVIVAVKPACISSTHIGKGDQQFKFTKVPSTTWQVLGPILGTSYATGSDTDFNLMYQTARANALSAENLKAARDKANESLKPGGKLYVDLQNLIAQTGNWASFTLTTEVLGDPNAPYLFCEDGTAVQ